MKIGFIGAGNMAQSLMGGVLAQGFESSQLLASDPSVECCDRVREMGASVCASNEELLANSSMVVLAVKPQMMQTVVSQLKNDFQRMKEQPVVISIAAGISCDMLDGWLGGGAAIIRCMPNTPSLLKVGATGMFANSNTTQQQKASAKQLLDAVGVAVWVDEECAIDAVTALSGSGPAYFFYMLEAMIDKATALGLDRTTAELLAHQTALGAASMAIESDVDVVELRRRVTSPGGTTAAALESFAANSFADMIGEGMAAAAERAKTLEEELQ